MDIDTKRRIDTARDILVGKIPDPKSQVEQITIALIYKFMDDMDKQSEELGGKAKFFTGEFAKYSWNNIFDPKVSGYNLVNLYSEAIQKMDHNPNIPQLFRDIFKNAYLPYRDPETLKMFLKIIGEFEYDHSERLGDAYEQLLSIMSSQGDAGQFRTPRHIIDFMVETVDPKKSETILDPACGTAGFLIFSYNHILNQNRIDNHVNLSPEERANLIQNIVGYDISPDMVRIALVNMYLHGFQNPRIYEYDTLTSEEHWNDYYDVILANPPFMSPRGGIRPHKRFSIQSKRSEVLFVDYIAEHLTPHGRGAVIVPEGIIFQSGRAYKKLRKNLIENSLYAVVSLPAGVFNPYSGVKTSILFLDKNLAKETDSILFIKVNNDGFNLGAQRRAIKENDLPIALEIIQKYQQSINQKKVLELNTIETKVAHLVKKEKVAKSGDYNLSGDRYRETVVYTGKWDFVKLSEICDIKKGSAIKKKDTIPGNIPVIAGGQQPAYFHNESNRSGDIITVSASGAYAGYVNYFLNPIFASDCTTIKSFDKKNVSTKFVFYLLKGKQDVIFSFQRGGAQPHVYPKDLVNFKIPLPPLEIQEQIVAELESYQKIIDGARQVVENYKPTFTIDPNWELIKLEDICLIQSGGTPAKNKKEYWEGGNIPWVGSAVCKDCFVNTPTNFITKEGLKYSSAKVLKEKTTLIALVGATIGKTGLLTFESATNQNIAGIYPKSIKKVLPEYLFFISRTLYPKFLNLGSGKFRMANISFVKNLEIPLPKIDVQKEIVQKIENEQKIIDANKELIKIYEQKIKDKIAEIWNDK